MTIGIAIFRSRFRATKLNCYTGSEGTIGTETLLPHEDVIPRLVAEEPEEVKRP